MQKDLIIYCSKFGTTKETVEKMKVAARNNVDIIDLQKEQFFNLNLYDRVFIGTGVYGNQLPEEITKILSSKATALKSKDVVFFVHGLAPEPVGKELVMSCANKFISGNKYKIYYLGGKLDSRGRNIFMKLFFSFIAKKANVDRKNPSTINELRITELLKCVANR